MLSTLPEPVQVAYHRYTRGDRGDEARAAKRVYMRLRRARATARRLEFEARYPGQRYIVDGITHGIGGYCNEGCRCRTCNISWKVHRR